MKLLICFGILAVNIAQAQYGDRGCVKPQSIDTCGKCVADDECKSGNYCCRYQKLCVPDHLHSCPAGDKAKCTNYDDCLSKFNSNFDKCTCTNAPNFPNDWVACNDGTSGTNTYTATNYQRVEDPTNGNLEANDEFALAILARHNYYRSEGSLNPLQWNEGLAAFATTWLQTLKTTCSMTHSTNSQRANKGGFSQNGENLYSGYVFSADVSDLVGNAIEAVRLWYSEIQYYVYPGQGKAYPKCPQRNGNGNEAIGHMTQVLWESTTDLGCDYAQCDDDQRVLISCVYGPAGNFQNQPAFSEASRSALNAAPDNAIYNGLPEQACEPPTNGVCADQFQRPCDLSVYTNCFMLAPYFGGLPACMLAAPNSGYYYCDMEDPDCN